MNILEQIVDWFRAAPDGSVASAIAPAVSNLNMAAPISPTVLPSPAAATHDERGYAGIRAEASYQDELQRALCDEANGKRRMTAEQSRDLYMIGMMHEVRVDAEGLPQLYIVPIPVLQKDIDDANSDRL